VLLLYWFGVALLRHLADSLVVDARFLPNILSVKPHVLQIELLYLLVDGLVGGVVDLFSLG